MTIKALKLDVFKHHSGDCSNGGISAKFNFVYLEHPEGNYKIDTDNPPENLCKLVKRDIFGRQYMHVEPVARPTGCGWMSGGCFVYSSDSRFRDISPYPLSLHDRQEF